MFDDLEVITKSYPDDFPVMRVYALGDVHIGSPEFNEEVIRKKIAHIESDEYGVVCVAGDLCDYGLKNAKTNVYEATMQPKEQQEFAYELFLPIVDKIVSLVPGNHEQRITREVGLCPLYDLSVRWGISDVYRENVAILKLTFGLVDGRKKRNCFIGITSHGTTRNKHRKFSMCFDNADFSISAHTHTPEYSPRGKIRINPIAGTATHVSYKEIVVDSSLDCGGYGLKNEYEVLPPHELQYLELSSYRDTDSNRSQHKVMDFHSIQIPYTDRIQKG